ncbi:MAG: hypothetical protein H8D23_37275 [Candidatus Brocadiales bacterium]|nr:hypothetical protein [Candidatus Brocadiales bacterium]
MKKDISVSGASRNRILHYRHDLLVWEFIDEMSAVMAEGAKSHGEPGDDGHWQKGFDDEGKDIWNHVFEHYRLYRLGDKSEPHLAKMAIGCMFQWYFDKERKDAMSDDSEQGSPTFAGDGCTPQGNCTTPEWSEGDSPNIRKYQKTFGEGPKPKTAEEILGERYAASQYAPQSNTTDSANQRTQLQ